MKISFKALEYTKEDRFAESEFGFFGSADKGWTITRNGAACFVLGPGYRPLQTVYCGICSTDLARRSLPFPLPQIIGHEAVARDPDTGTHYVVEINDTCAARGDASPDIFCSSGLSTHCPERRVFGIDRLPGGFAPWILVPVNAALPCDGFPLRAATLIEPFAAALHAVTVSPPRTGDLIAVAGAGRLGLLMVAALSSYRKDTGADFSIAAIARSGRNLGAAKDLGADTVIDVTAATPSSLEEKFDIVFDATGSPEGLDLSLGLARREVHLKSTHGRPFHNIAHLTELVVDELSLLPCSATNLDFHWPDEVRDNEWIYAAPGADIRGIPDRFKVFRGDIGSAYEFLRGPDFHDRVPRFDIALVENISDIDRCIRPVSGHEISLVRPRGAIVVKKTAGNGTIGDFLNSGKSLRTSRCGDFRHAIETLRKNTRLLETIERRVITHEFTADRLPHAFETAQSPEAIKVIIRHSI